METKENKYMAFIGKTLSSEAIAAMFLLFGAVCWFFEQSVLCITGFSFMFVCIFLFCKDVKNVFALLFFIPFFLLNKSSANDVWNVYIVCIACCATAVIGFTVTRIILEKKQLKRGKLFFPLFLFAATLMTGGLIGRFNPVMFGAFFAAAVVIVAFYFIAVNFTENLTEYLAKLFIFGAIILTLEILITHLRQPDFLKSIKGNPGYWFSAETMNTAAIVIALGIAGVFKLGLGKKHDYLYLLLALVFVGGVLISKCRVMTLFAVAAWMFTYIYFFIKTANKKIFVWGTVVAILIVAGVAIVFRKKVLEIIKGFVDKNSSSENTDADPLNGRTALWQYCIERFLKYPVFGFGYLTDIGDGYKEKTDIVNMVLAHNSMLQWITCSGIVGAGLMTLFYCFKYKALFENFNRKKVFTVFSVLIIALSGVLDQAASMDFFIVLLPFVIMAGEESRKTMLNGVC